MADEPLVKEPLTEEMINAGAELTRRLDEANWLVVASFWYFVPEQNQWKLIFASPRLLSDGPAQAYYAIRRASPALREQFPSLKQIYVVPPDDEVVEALGLAVHTGWTISGIRFSRNTINGRFIEDAYLYRIAQPRLSDNPVWLVPTPELRALDEKPVRIKEVGSEWDAKLAVEDADPRGANAGRCSVRAWQAPTEDINIAWTNAGGAIPTGQIHLHQKFLNEDSVKLLRNDPEDPEFGRLILDLS